LFRKKFTSPVDVQWVIVGLGNPGPEYAHTRHNVGFDFIDEIAKKHKIKLDKAKHRSRFGVGEIEGVGVVLVRPMTFMNVSGQAVAPLLREYNVKPDHLLVIADDLDLDVGRVRCKPKGSAGGHNGHKNLIQLLGTDEYARLKIGIGSVAKSETIDFVLSKFTAIERIDINSAIERCITGTELLLRDGVDRAISWVNDGQKS
jgi:peptidyl-tRNA hydrolase, PTH1 family